MHTAKITYVSIRQHISAYVRVRAPREEVEDEAGYGGVLPPRCICRRAAAVRQGGDVSHIAFRSPSLRARCINCLSHVSIRQYTSASLRQRTSACVSITVRARYANCLSLVSRSLSASSSDARGKTVESCPAGVSVFVLLYQ